MTELLKEALPYYFMAGIAVVALISYIKGHNRGYKDGTINAEKVIKDKDL